MIIIINKLQIRGKRFCEKRVRGSNLGVKCGQMPSPRPSPTGRGRRARIVGRVSAAPPGGGLEARIDRRRQLLQQQFAVFPAQARVGDRLAVNQRLTRHDFLRAFADKAFGHNARDGG